MPRLNRKQGAMALPSSVERPNAEQGVPLSSFRAIFIAALLILTQLVQVSYMDHLLLPESLRALTRLLKILQIAPFGAGVAAASSIGRELNVSDHQSAWIAASYPYVLPTSYP